MIQKIRLIVNVITPDNFDKKFEELRGYLFGSAKTSDDPEYNAEIDKFEHNEASLANLEIVVERIFKKA